MPDLQYSLPRLAEIYDLGNSGSEDHDFYLAVAGPAPQDVLDLGCGTGVLTHKLAALGHRVIGVDPAEAMLDVATGKPDAKAIEWHLATAEDFHSDRRFDLIIMTGHAFQCLLDDVQIRAVLRVMATHLKPDGRAVFESRNPHIDWDKQWARQVTLQHDGASINCERRMLFTNATPDCLSFAWDYHFTNETLTSESTLRFASHTEITALATSAGLQLHELIGDWSGAPFYPNASREMIFTFKRLRSDSQ